MVLVVIVVLTFYTAAFPGFFTEVFGRPLHVAAAAAEAPAGLLASLRAVRVVLQLAAVFGLTVAPRLLQAL